MYNKLFKDVKIYGTSSNLFDVSTRNFKFVKN